MANETGRDIRHRIVLEERSRLSVSGVTDVVSFDDESITADTDMGMIIIRGEDLHIGRLNLDEGVLQVDGSEASRGGFLLGKIFK